MTEQKILRADKDGCPRCGCGTHCNKDCADCKNCDSCDCKDCFKPLK